jgi:hypothetical protein
MIYYTKMPGVKNSDIFWFFEQKKTTFTWLPRTSMLGKEHMNYHPDWANKEATTSQLRRLLKVVWTVKRIEGYK